MARLTTLPAGYRAIVVGATGGIGGAIHRMVEADENCATCIGLGRTTEPALDILNERSIENAARQLASAGPVHLIFDATGVLHDETVQPEKTIDAIDPEAVARSFAVNATGPLLLLKHLRNLLPVGERCIFATLSARVGSIGDNRLGGWYGYRASKAALHMFLATAAIEIARKRPEAICLALHPGTVRTDLSAPFAGKRPLMEPDETAARLLSVIDNATARDTGSFIAYDGSLIPW